MAPLVRKPRRRPPKTQLNQLDQALASVYYNYGEEGALNNTPRHLLRLARNKIKDKRLLTQLNMARIRLFLTRQSSYTVHRRMSKRAFPRRRIRLTARAIRADADLVELGDLAPWNSGYRFILVVIDAFTKYVWATPTKSKHMKNIAKALSDIFDSSGQPPQVLYTDAGTEFTGAAVQTVLKDNHVTHRICGGEAYHCPFVERVNRTLKEKMFQAMTAMHTRRWIDLLPRVVSTYNKTIHSTIGMRPGEATDDKTLTIWENTYKKERQGKQHRSPKYAYKVGDYVRILKEQTAFSRGFLPRFTWEIFQIAKQLNDRRALAADGAPAYLLKDMSGTLIENAVFYERELSRVDPSLVKGRRAIFPVHKILGRRKTKAGIPEIKVWWQGWPEKAAEWIPASQLTAEDSVEDL